MKRLGLLFLVVTLMLGCFTGVHAANIELPDLISDHMLLQQGKPIQLWGSATPGETVTIELKSENSILSKGEAKAGTDGKFSAKLPAVMAGGPYSLIFTSPSSTVTVQDVLVGELWVQSGQSNMVKKISSTGSFANAMLPAQTMDQIRLFTNDKEDLSATRRTDLQGSWVIASRTEANNYSAVGYTALQTLYNKLNLPMGGICCGIGGANMSSYQGPSTTGGTGGQRYNTKIAPLTQLNVRGVMWYQGEGDRGNSNFASDFKKLITSYRTDWKDADMPFLFVTLPPSPMKFLATWLNPPSYIIQDFSTARLGQLQTYHDLPNVGMAVSMDCKPNPGEDSLHPNNKKPVGERLAYSALGLVYGREEKWSSPLYASATAEGSSAVITFSHAYDGLKTTDNLAPRCFMAAGADGKFYSASAIISSKNIVTITCPQVSQITTVSYGVEKQMYPYTSADDAVINTYANVNLVNSAGFPLCPFSFAVTEVKPAKTPLYQTAPINSIAALGEPYAFDDTVVLNTTGGQTSEQKVLWSIKQISTSKQGTVSIYGLTEGSDLLIPATITIQPVTDSPFLNSISAIKQQNKLSISVPLGTVEANREVILMTGYYGEKNALLSASSVKRAVRKGQKGQLNFETDIPSGATKVKVFVLNQNLLSYLPVFEQTLN